MTSVSRLLASLGLVAAATPVQARERWPAADALSSAPASELGHESRSAVTGLPIARAQERLGAPAFVGVEKEARGPDALRAAAQSSEEAEREMREGSSRVSGLERTDVERARGSGTLWLREGGGLVTVGQQVDGVEVFGQSLKVLLDAKQLPVAVSGHLSPVASSARYAKGVVFRLEPREAIAEAYRDLAGHVLPIQGLVETGRAQGRYRSFALSPGPRAVRLARPARAKPIYYAMPDALVPAYYVELSTVPVEGAPSGLYAHAIAADDGRTLYRHALSRDLGGVSSDEAWAHAEAPFLPWDTAMPHPTGVPEEPPGSFIARNQVTLSNAPFSWNTTPIADLVEPGGSNAGASDGSVTQADDPVHRSSSGVVDEQVMAAVTHDF